MATPSAVLSVLVNADTAMATAKLTKFDAQLRAADDVAKKGIEARLGATLDPAAFDAYKAKIDEVRAKTADRAAFKAQLGADFSPRGFIAYQRALADAEKSSIQATEATKVAAEKQAAETQAALDEQAAAQAATMEKMKSGAASGFAAMGSAAMKWGKIGAAGAVAMGVGAVYAGVKFQQATTLLNTQAGASVQQVNKLRDGILDMASSVGQKPDALAQGMYHVVSSMNAVLPPTTRTASELKILGTAAKLATVGGSNLEETSYALASAMNALHTPVSDTSKVAGQLNAIVGSGDMTMTDLIDTFKSGLLPAARTAGTSLQSVGAALAVMGDQGMRGSLAGTRLRMSIALLSSPAEASAKVLDTLGLSAKQATSTSAAMSSALQQAGLRTTQLGADLRKPDGFMVALQDLDTHLRESGLTATGAAAVMNKAFGGGRMGATVNLLANSTDRLRTKFEQIGATASDFGQKWEATTKTVSFQMKSFEAAVLSLAVQVGDKLMPAVSSVLGVLTMFVKQIEDGKGAGGVFRDVMTALATAVVKVWDAIKNVALVFASLFRLFQQGNPWVVALTAAVAGLVVGALALGAALTVLAAKEAIATLGTKALEAATILLESSFALPVVAIGLLVGALVVLYLKVKLVRDIFNTVWTAIKNTVVTVINQMIGVIQGFLKIIDGLITFWKGVFNGNFSEMWKGIKEIFQGGIQAIIDWFGTVPAMFLAVGTAIGNAIGSGVESVFVDIANWIIGKVRDLVKEINSIASSIPLIGGNILTAPSYIGAKGAGPVAANSQLLAGKTGAAHRPANDYHRTIPTLPHGARHAAAHGHSATGGSVRLPGSMGVSTGGPTVGVNPTTGQVVTHSAAEWKKIYATYNRVHHTHLAVGQAPAGVASGAGSTSLGAASTTTGLSPAEKKLAAFLAYMSHIPSQALAQQIKSTGIQNRLASATAAGNVGGEESATRSDLKLERSWLAADKAKLAKIDAQLARRGLSRATRNALLQDKLALLQEIGTITGQVGSLGSSLSTLTGGTASGGASASTSQFDMAPAGGTAIQMPTKYDAMNALNGGPSMSHHHGDIHIYVQKDGDVKKVADAIDRKIGSSIHARLRRNGMRGT